MSLIGYTAAMMADMDNRYYSITASVITKMIELVSAQYKNLKESMPRHVEKPAVMVEQTRAMGKTLDKPLLIVIFVTSLTVHEFKPATTVIKTLAG